MTTRRAARNQSLPPAETEMLRNLDLPALRPTFLKYCRELYEAGWTLRAIGDALQPPRARSTVRSWVTRASDNVTVPKSLTPSAPILATPQNYVHKKPKSPGISPLDRLHIETFAPVARTYRARMPSTSDAAEANRLLTELCLDLHAKHVTVQELADAAGVTYRAMARRLGKLSR